MFSVVPANADTTVVPVVTDTSSTASTPAPVWGESNLNQQQSSDTSGTSSGASSSGFISQPIWNTQSQSGSQ